MMRTIASAANVQWSELEPWLISLLPTQHILPVISLFEKQIKIAYVICLKFKTNLNGTYLKFKWKMHETLIWIEKEDSPDFQCKAHYLLLFGLNFCFFPVKCSHERWKLPLPFRTLCSSDCSRFLKLNHLCLLTISWTRRKPPSSSTRWQ